MSVEKTLQEKILQYRILESRIETLNKQLNLILNKMNELEQTKNGLKELEKCKQLNFSLGSEVYVKGEVTDKKKVFVGIGANIFIEKTFEEATQILKKRKEELEKIAQQIQNEISNLLSILQQIGKEIKKEVDKNVQPV